MRRLLAQFVSVSISEKINNELFNLKLIGHVRFGLLSLVATAQHTNRAAEHTNLHMHGGIHNADRNSKLRSLLTEARFSRLLYLIFFIVLTSYLSILRRVHGRCYLLICH